MITRILALWRWWFCPGIGGGGGGGGSSSTTETTTQQIDKRQVVDGTSVGVSSDSSTVNVTYAPTDMGAIAGALDLAKTGDTTNAQNFASVIGLADKVLDRLLTQSTVGLQVGADAIRAYSPPSIDPTSQKSLLIGAAIVAAIVVLPKVMK